MVPLVARRNDRRRMRNSVKIIVHFDVFLGKRYPEAATGTGGYRGKQERKSFRSAGAIYLDVATIRGMAIYEWHSNTNVSGAFAVG